MIAKICKKCPYSDVEDDNIKCFYGKESYPKKCPKSFSDDEDE